MQCSLYSVQCTVRGIIFQISWLLNTLKILKFGETKREKAMTSGSFRLGHHQHHQIPSVNTLISQMHFVIYRFHVGV